MLVNAPLQRPEKSSGWRRSSKRVRACSACRIASISAWRGRWSHGRRESGASFSQNSDQPPVVCTQRRASSAPPRSRQPTTQTSTYVWQIGWFSLALSHASGTYTQKRARPPASAAAAWRVASSSAAGLRMRRSGGRADGQPLVARLAAVEGVGRRHAEEDAVDRVRGNVAAQPDRREAD